MRRELIEQVGLTLALSLLGLPFTLFLMYGLGVPFNPAMLIMIVVLSIVVSVSGNRLDRAQRRRRQRKDTPDAA
jgi:hypothetical protein